MRTLNITLAAALVAGAAAATIAIAGGGPLPPAPAPPQAHTVVAHGTGHARVDAPAIDQRTDANVGRAVRAARNRAIPKAIDAARAEAAQLARATGLRLGEPVGVSRDAAPVGFWDDDEGRYGPGRWCRTVRRARTVQRAGATPQRVVRPRLRCQAPGRASARVTVRFAARTR